MTCDAALDASPYRFDVKTSSTMPLPLAPFFAFVLGVFLAWRSRAETNHDEGVWNFQTQAVALYAALVFAPVAGYFAAFASDWSYAYFIDGRAIPSAISLTLVLVAAGAVVGGFVTGRRALERHAPNELVWLAGAPTAFVVVVFAALHNRFGVDATYEQFVSDFGREPLFTSRLGFAVVWMNSIVVTGAVFTARWLAPRLQPGQTTPQPVLSVPVSPNIGHDGGDEGGDEGGKRFLGRPKTPR
jgi:hypothetical protein